MTTPHPLVRSFLISRLGEMHAVEKRRDRERYLRRRKAKHEQQRRKYVEDSTFRESYLKKRRDRRRHRYSTDLEYRERMKLRALTWSKTEKGRTRLRRQRLNWRHRYSTDPEFRKQWKLRNRQWLETETGRAYRRAYEREYGRKRYATSALTRIKTCCSSRINDALKRRLPTKNRRRTLEIVGCTVGELMTHLEKQFLPGMSWDNHGRYGWHIDHRIPCTAFDLTDPVQLRACFHFSNLQPLWAADNLRKGGLRKPKVAA